MFLTRPPRAPLDAAISAIWVVESNVLPFRLERVLPTGAAQLIVNLKEDAIRRYEPRRGMACETSSGAVLAGVQSRFGVIDTAEQEWVAGVSFKPGGMLSFTRVPAAATLDLDVELDEVLPRALVRTLRDQLLDAPDAAGRLDRLEAALLEAWTGAMPHPAVRFALERFSHHATMTSVAAVTDETGLSPKRLIERFKADVGVTPKRFCRILRFQRAVSVAHTRGTVDWTSVALDCGYYDQSHLIHDFREFSGLTPSEYLSYRTAHQNHVKFLQDIAVGL
jgi:AraC-like DNA-binding protein